MNANRLKPLMRRALLGAALGATTLAPQVHAQDFPGTTPVMTLDKIALYGFGTFSARVVINDGKYAGTWQHDKVGGHLFGKIEKPAAEKKEVEDKK